MDGWDCNANGDRAVLGRIVALLLALAGFADLATGLSFFRRREVLGILNCGEAAARALFAGMADGPDDDTLAEEDAPAPADMPCRDASLLAARFRLLAFMLAALLTLADLSTPPSGEVKSSPLASADNRRGGQRPRPLHHASRGPPPP